jgi:GT2 family glycosyltransferase
MIRKTVINRIGGYCDFYHYAHEENEYALRVLDAGFCILFFPAVVVHHRVSNVGRRPGKIWAYTLRNSLWTAILRMPAKRLPAESLWKFAVGTLDAMRLLQVKLCLCGHQQYSGYESHL